ncbi:fatty acid oxidation complex subunit alpha FadB [Alcanivorax sp. JB21]|uniref:fatty acid oxidation complex subunit alpha FadB n=1 Tax=Alcanivorax limicola TaxID=2874102 RepID=UPI001CBB2A5C|nr:fatty acid oxidation complex subunit alpha FadB [Alcanivorax limicola]MBZ2188482.1 fatty acid oxidation complex subunit alpha FadB [Alcanivorax limicola]
MIYSGKAVSAQLLDDGIAELKFDLQGESVNKFNRDTMEDLGKAVDALKADSKVKGVIVTSGKEVFIVGADITEFTDMFKQTEEEIAGWCIKANQVFTAFEDLPVPTVCAINGIALGGGLEMALTCDFRVMSSQAQVGLPEVKLGLFPGFGGTVRMPRLIGVDNAVEWIAAGGQHRADKAIKDGVVDAVVEPAVLRDAAINLVKECLAGKIDHMAKRNEKLVALTLPAMENMMAFQTSGAFVAQQAGKNYPAPMAAVNVMQQHATMTRDKALEAEAKGFAKVAKTPQATALVGLFLADQAVKKTNGKFVKAGAGDLNQAAVLGAGIMGGGIAYQSAFKGTPIIMKDIADKALDLGMNEATKLLAKRVDRKKMDAAKMGKTLSMIRPTLNYGDFDNVDVVVEAVVENAKIKQSVLAEAEGKLKDGAILASNTSTISITSLATALKKPENFAGMHFFNPVSMMPLVEVIRGEKTSDTTVATLVKYAQKIGKNPIVVNDCPGFLVNRVLFPYFGGFGMLMRDGADFQAVDKVMEKFGWPMGPAYLMDVVGIDTGVHAAQVMAEGFPERMQYDFKDVSTVMFENERYGQKNGVGFYKYEEDKKGKPKKVVDDTTYDLIKPHVAERKEFDADEVIARMMIPMCTEIVRCLEDNIVGTAAEADMAMIYGVGFPPFRGGPLRYIDSIGAKEFVALCDKYAHLGGIYEAPQLLKDMAAKGQSFFG